ncbi:AAA family ATPase [Mycoplasmatota bacterium]|nr:AAA family ATPase [Mycoplasmatota bacterium]
MKKLKKIKLINWHYFINETIDIEGNTLITGENGAGKSTILDAIQYVLSPGRQKFNIAANDKTKRTVNAYVRGKLGRSDQRYLREGDVTCHISLEFFDELTNESFVVGTVLDSSDTISSPNSLFYDLPNVNISDDLFINDDKIPFNIKEFKKNVKESKLQNKLANTLVAARKNIAFRFNISDYNFFELLPKALAFKPINNVKDFIYSYILEEKDLDIEYLIGNIKTYKEFINILEGVNEKLTDLKEIDETHKSVISIEEEFKTMLYVYKKCFVDNLAAQIKLNEDNRTSYSSKLDLLSEEKRVLKTELNSIISKRDDVHLSLLVDDDYKMLNRLNSDKEELSSKIEGFSSVNSKIDRIIIDEFLRAEKLLAQGYSDKSISRFLNFKNVTLDIFNINEFIDVVSDYYSFIIRTKNAISERKILENVKKEIVEESLTEIYQDIKVLNEKKVLIPKDVLGFRNRLKELLKERRDYDTTPIILSEVLEIKDKRWQNAIEGYLGRDRFNILVNPEFFNESLKIYKEIRSEFKKFPISLVNTEKLTKYKDENIRGLASEIESNYSYAKYYINYRLNNLVKCENVEDLPTHNQAVTPDCIIYRGYTVSELNKRNYERLYIGSDAHVAQLKQSYNLLDNKRKELAEHNKIITKYDDLVKLLDLHDLSYVKDRIDVKIETFSKINTLNELNETINNLKVSTVSDKQEIIKKLEEEYGKLQTRLENLTEEISLITHKLSEISSDEEAHLQLDEERIKLEEYEVEISVLMNVAKQKLDKVLEESKDDKYLLKSLELKLKTQEKDYLSRVNDLVILQRMYSTNHNFEALEGIKGMDAFFEEQQRLRTSHLISYEEKVYESKHRSESELQEHFIFRLHESLLEARRHFTELNNSLSGVMFGTDEYEFVFRPNSKYSDYYEMLLDSVNYESNTEGFSKEFLDKYGKTLEKLTEYIVREDINEKFLEEIVDYRTYMDYDIRIIHGDESESLLSEISREKSGGETQIPYYVAMASTFIKIYQSNSVNSDSMGIVLFDEAFDKIDSTRTEAMMNFLSNLGLQVIISTPPQKVEDIYPFVDSTLVVTRDTDYSWVFTLNKEVLEQ